MARLSNATYNDLLSKFEEQPFLNQKPTTRLDAFRQSVGRPHAEIDYDLIAGIIAGMADYSSLLFNHSIEPATGITFVRKNKERSDFNRLFLGSNRKLVVELQRGSCMIYIINRSNVTIDWKTAIHVIRSLHDLCDENARSPGHYAELIKRAHESGWISNRFRSMMEKQI